MKKPNTTKCKPGRRYAGGPTPARLIRIDDKTYALFRAAAKRADMTWAEWGRRAMMKEAASEQRARDRSSLGEIDVGSLSPSNT